MSILEFQLEQTTLTPILWNLCVISTICCLLAWCLRILIQFTAIFELQHALRCDATICVKDIGHALDLFKIMPTRHLEQLLRASTIDNSIAIDRIDIPFEVIPETITLDDTNEQYSLQFQVHSTIPIGIQVFTLVKASTLEAFGELQRQKPTELIANAVQTSFRQRRPSLAALRNSLKSFLPPLDSITDVEEQKLPQKTNVKSTKATSLNITSTISRYLQSASSRFRYISLIFTPETYMDASTLQCILKPTNEPEECTITWPKRVDSSNEDDQRYSAVLVVGHVNSFNGDSSAQSPDPTQALWQCLVFDFVPLGNVGLSPVIVHRLVATSSKIFLVREIFGRQLSNRELSANHEMQGVGQATLIETCVICLEASSVSVVLLPCRHACVCDICVDEISQCPICRTPFTTYARYGN